MNLPPASCPHCGRKHDLAKAVSDSPFGMPRDGDFSICGRCYSISIFTVHPFLGTRSLRTPTPAEHDHARQHMPQDVFDRAARYQEFLKNRSLHEQEPVACLSCGGILDLAEEIGPAEGHGPADGDGVICANCGNVAILTITPDGHHALRELTTKELDDYASFVREHNATPIILKAMINQQEGRS